MLCSGPQRSMLPCAAASTLAALWGKDPLHPSSAVHKKMAGTIVDNLRDSGVRYTIPLKELSHEIEMCCSWYGWIEPYMDMNL